MALTKVSTDGVKDDAITSGKIPANAVGASELADNAVDTNAIADNAVTAGKTSGVQTTINNNADNRVITGSGSANTLNGESSVVIDANGKLGVGNTNPADFDAYADRLVVGTTSGNNGMTIVAGSSNSSSIYFADGTSGGSQKNAGIVDYNHSADKMRFATAASDAMVIDSSGKVGIGTNSPTEILHIKEGTNKNLHFTGGIGQIGNVTGFYAVNDANNAIVDIGMTGSTVRFGTTAGERGRFTGDGLCFNGDTAAANALNDYEEGTWTPTVSSGMSNVQYETYGRQGGYTKIGRYVFITMTIHMGGTTSTTGSGIQITGLPFTAKSFSHDNTNPGGLYLTYHDGFSSQTQGLIQDGTNRIDLVRFDGSGSLTGTSVNAGREFRMAGSYMT